VKKLDLSSLIGLILGFASLFVAFVMEGGDLGSLFQVTAAMIVFGGTIGVVIVSFPFEKLKSVPSLLKVIFTGKPMNPLSMIDELINLATIARREGILALEEQIENSEDEFFKNGIRLVVDGVDPDLVRSILETELAYIEDRHESGASIFEAAGGYAPTLGIIGTVMGLVHVLGSLSNIDKLGPLIATAFIATLYGVASANLIYLPMANKLKVRSKQEILAREIMIEGILSIQAGENPTILGQKLKAFLAPKDREAKQARTGSEANVETA
jgi:chemotaxis protein MotA